MLLYDGEVKSVTVLKNGDACLAIADWEQITIKKDGTEKLPPS